MNETQKNLNNIISLSEYSGETQTNTPVQYADRQKQYFAQNTHNYVHNKAKYSSDFIQARVQGLTPNFYDWVTTYIRLADIIQNSASATRKSENFKQIIFADKHIDYFPIGAKLECMGSTWICVNPENLSSALSNAIIQRCNASYNSYDDYGNVITEPIAVINYLMYANSDTSPINMVLPDGNFQITAQLNDNTRKLGLNKRIILGDKPYIITGFTDFLQEFSGDRTSCHFLNFAARLDEPTETDDVSVNFIANGLSFNYSAELYGDNNITVGQAGTLHANFLLNGEILPATAQYPLTWNWSTSDKNVATIDENGVVTGISEGNCTVTAILAQNETITATVELSVVAQIDAPTVKFSGYTVPYIKQYMNATVSAVYIDGNGQSTTQPLTWSFSGAEESDYNATVGANGMTVNIECVSPCDTPLTVKASYGGYYAETSIELRGY